MSRFLLSWSSHCAEIRNCIVWSRRPSYSCLHWALRSAGFGVGVPFGTFCLAFAAVHCVKFGGSGATTSWGFWPVVCACCFAAAVSQWLNVSLVIAVSPTLATEFDGTESLPQPAISATRTAIGARRRVLSMAKRVVAGPKARLSV